MTLRKYPWAIGRRDAHLRRKYKITLAALKVAVEFQNGLCAICKKKEINEYTCFVDHCHETNEFRGALCIRCNSGLAMFNDNVSFLRNAIDYIEKHNGKGKSN